MNARRRLRAWMSRLLGTRGEAEAARYLKRHGLRVILRGHRVRHGEIDLIARDGDVLVFVEVKTRRRGDPAEAVTPLKQRRVAKAALRFVRYHGLDEVGVPFRFDVVAVVWRDDRSRPAIEHYRDAFRVPEDLPV